MIDERDLKRVEAIILSMTPDERRDPDLIKGRRKERIAKGSGTEIENVNDLITQFRSMQKMMKQMTGGAPTANGSTNNKRSNKSKSKQNKGKKNTNTQRPAKPGAGGLDIDSILRNMR
jgi:signal recognition particle subunit SRP54